MSNTAPEVDFVPDRKADTLMHRARPKRRQTTKSSLAKPVSPYHKGKKPKIPFKDYMADVS